MAKLRADGAESPADIRFGSVVIGSDFQPAQLLHAHHQQLHIGHGVGCKGCFVGGIRPQIGDRSGADRAIIIHIGDRQLHRAVDAAFRILRCRSGDKLELQGFDAVAGIAQEAVRTANLCAVDAVNKLREAVPAPLHSLASGGGNAVTAHTGHVDGHRQSAGGHHHHTGDLIDIILPEGQGNDLAGSQHGDLLVREVNEGRVVFPFHAFGLILGDIAQGNSQILGLRLQHQRFIYALADTEGHDLFIHIGPFVIHLLRYGNIQLSVCRTGASIVDLIGVDDNTGADLLDDGVIDIGVGDIRPALCLDGQLVQNGHARGLDAQHVEHAAIAGHVQRAGRSLPHTPRRGIGGRRLDAVVRGGVRQLQIGIDVNIQHVILGNGLSGQDGDVAAVGIQIDLVFDEVDPLAGFGVVLHQQLIGRDSVGVHIGGEQADGIVALILVVCVEQQVAFGLDQRHSYAADVPGTALSLLQAFHVGINIQIHQLPGITEGDDKPVGLIGLEHIGIAPGGECGSRAAVCVNAGGIARCLVGVLIHQLHDVKAHVLGFACAVVVAHITVHRAGEGHAHGGNRHQQIHRIGAVGHIIGAHHFLFGTAALTQHAAGCAFIAEVNVDPADPLHRPLAAQAAVAAANDLNAVDVQLVEGVALAGDILRNDPDRKQLTIILIGLNGKGFCISGPESVTAELLVCLHKGAGSVLEDQLEVELVFGTGVFRSGQGAVARHSHFHLISVSCFCKADVLQGFLIAHGILDVTPGNRGVGQGTLGISAALTGLDGDLFFLLHQQGTPAREGKITLESAAVVPVCGDAACAEAAPGDLAPAQLIQAVDVHLGHLPVVAGTILQRKGNAGKLADIGDRNAEIQSAARAHAHPVVHVISAGRIAMEIPALFPQQDLFRALRHTTVGHIVQQNGNIAGGCGRGHIIRDDLHQIFVRQRLIHHGEAVLIESHLKGDLHLSGGEDIALAAAGLPQVDGVIGDAGHNGGPDGIHRHIHLRKRKVIQGNGRKVQFVDAAGSRPVIMELDLQQIGKVGQLQREQQRIALLGIACQHCGCGYAHIQRPDHTAGENAGGHRLHASEGILIAHFHSQRIPEFGIFNGIGSVWAHRTPLDTGAVNVGDVQTHGVFPAVGGGIVFRLASVVNHQIELRMALFAHSVELGAGVLQRGVDQFSVFRPHLQLCHSPAGEADEAIIGHIAVHLLAEDLVHLVDPKPLAIPLSGIVHDLDAHNALDFIDRFKEIGITGLRLQRLIVGGIRNASAAAVAVEDLICFFPALRSAADRLGHFEAGRTVSAQDVFRAADTGGVLIDDLEILNGITALSTGGHHKGEGVFQLRLRGTHTCRGVRGLCGGSGLTLLIGAVKPRRCAYGHNDHLRSHDTGHQQRKAGDPDALAGHPQQYLFEAAFHAHSHSSKG